MSPISGKNFSLTMINMGFKSVGPWWNYKNIISPFYRLYYIEGGHGRVYINNEVFDLEPGDLFLIPKFAFHCYECDKQMDHYYFGFFDDYEIPGGIPSPLEMKRKVKANALDVALIKHYLEINPNRELQVIDPQKYGNGSELYRQLSRDNFSDALRIESEGILLQLFSHFINERCLKNGIIVNGNKNMQPVIKYIFKNLGKRISVTELADMMCLSTDHFSKVFKKIIGMTPSEYIQMKRIERAEALLLTSNMNITQIAESIGFSSPAQFSRLFVKATHYTPSKYRSKQLNLMARRKDLAD